MHAPHPTTQKEQRWGRIETALREAGHKSGFQTVAAKMVGIKQPSVAAWKAGTSTPDMDHIIILAEKLGVCVEWLYTGRGPKKPGDNLPDDLRELAGFWGKLTPEARDHLIGTARLWRSTTFTGDPEKRDQYQETIARKPSQENKAK